MADAAKSLKVFVSYSRTDVEFADQLVLALEDKGFQTILDRHDMSGGENWRERLGKLILSADAVTFILSEKSAASEICAWEVEEAHRLSKRILPVTPASVADVKPPRALSDLNWIPFFADPAVPGSGFYYGVKRLEEALRVDLDWLRAQTRYSERSVEWTKSSKAEDLLLRGEALREAHAWLGRTPAGSSPPESVREYLSASADAEQKREAATRLQIEEREKAVKVAEAAVTEKQQAVVAKARTDRTLRALAMTALVAGVVLVATAGVGIWFATRNFVEVAARDSKLFAREANILSARGDKVMAMMVALSGDPAARRGPLERWFNPNGYPLAREALARALATNRLVGSVPTGEPITAMVAFADDSHFLTFHKNGVVHMWEADKSVPLQTIKLKEDVKRAILFKDGLRALTLTSTGRPVLIRLSDGAEQGVFTGEEGREITSIALGPDEKQVLTGGYDGAIELWSIATGERVARWEALEPPESTLRFGEVVGLDFTKDGTGFVSADGSGTIARWELKTTKPVVRAQLGDYLSASSLTLPPDAEMVIVGASNGRMYGYTLTELKVSGDYQVFDLTLDNAITSVLYSQKSENMVVTSQSGRVSIFRNNGSSSNEFGSIADITAAIHLKGGQTAITGSRDGAVRQWSLAKASTQLMQTGGQGLDADSQGPLPQFITLSGDGQQALIRYFNDDANKLWRKGASPDTTDFNALSMSPDGKFAIRLKHPPEPGGIGLDREREVVRLDNNKVVHTIAGDINPIAFVRSDALLLQDVRGALSIWKFGATTAQWTSEQPIDGGYGGVFATSPDGSRVLAIYDRKVVLWEIGNSKAKATLAVDEDVTEARFLPDSKRFVLGFRTGELEMWSVDSSAPLESFDGHNGEVRQVAFNKTGSLMASAAIDGTASLWRIGQPEQLQTFDTRGSVYSIAFDPKGEKVVIASQDGISEWQIEPVALADADNQVEMACKQLEKLNVIGFSTREVLSIPTLKGLPNNPCVAMGITQLKASPAMAKPATFSASTGAGSAP